MNFPDVNICSEVSKDKKIFIFTDCDLDGAGSYLMFKWFIRDYIPYKAVRVNDFKKVFLSWFKNNGKKYDHIYILDLDISQDSLEVVDRKNITIIDHHKTHIENKSKYKNATTLIQEYTSCTKLIYNIFSKNYNKDLTDEQKLLVLGVDDYDSYELKLPFSYEMNLLFWNYQGDRIKRFLQEFGTGFSGFTNEQRKIINYYKDKFKVVKDGLDVYRMDLSIAKKKYSIVSTFADTFINEVAEHIISDNKADIGFVVNLKSKKVSLRRSKGCTVDLGKFAGDLFEVGGGHEASAGGIINDKFLALTKLFQQI